jgi:RNA ligase
VTPHLPGSHGTPDDEFATNVDLPRVLRECTLVQEKLDGLNLGLRIRAGRLEPVLKDRVPDRAENEALTPVLEALRDRFADLDARADLRVFGELLNPAQPDIRNWRIFDVFEERAGKFWAYRRVAGAAASLRVETVPVLSYGKLRSAAQLTELLQADGAHREGVVLRIEAGDWLSERYKFVIAGFRKSPWSLL